MAASRCKECFHDFTEKPRRSSAGPIALLAALAAMAIVGGLTFWFLSSRPQDSRVLLNEETQTIDFISYYGEDDVKVETVPWADVEHLEHLTKSNGSFELAAHTTSGSRIVIERSADRPLLSKAEHYAATMDKPLEEISKARGFGTPQE